MLLSLNQCSPCRLGRSRARYELSGLREGGRPNSPCGQRGQQAALGRLQCHAKRVREPLDGLVVEILSHVAIDGGRFVQHRHTVHEPKEPDLEIIIVHGPFARLLNPPLRGYR